LNSPISSTWLTLSEASQDSSKIMSGGVSFSELAGGYSGSQKSLPKGRHESVQETAYLGRFAGS